MDRFEYSPPYEDAGGLDVMYGQRLTVHRTLPLDLEVVL